MGDITAPPRRPFLRADLPLEVPAGTYSVDAQLLDSNGAAIALGTLDPAAVAGLATTAQLGSRPPTRAGLLFRAGDSGVRDGRSLYVDVKVIAEDVSAPIVRSWPGPVRLRAELMSGQTLLGVIDRDVPQMLSCLASPAIGCGRLVWTVHIGSSCGCRTATSNRKRSTRAPPHQAASFAKPAVHLEAAMADTGEDADTAGAYRLGVPDAAEQVISITAAPSLGPWTSPA